MVRLQVLKYLIINLILILNAYSQEFYFGKSVKSVIEKRKNATIIIKVINKLTQVGTIGTGTITNRGIITNFHVIKDYYFNNKDFDLVLETNNKKIFKNVNILKCSEDKKRDICLIENPISDIKDYFKITPSMLGQNQTIYKIGNCNGREFHAENGRLSVGFSGIGVEEADGTVNDLDILVITGIFNDCTFGSSGGPVFDHQGRLLAISVASDKDSKEQYLISLFDVIEFLDGKDKADTERARNIKFIKSLSKSYSVTKKQESEKTGEEDEKKEDPLLPDFMKKLLGQ